MKTKKIKAWAVVDNETGGLFEVCLEKPKVKSIRTLVKAVPCTITYKI